MVLNLLLVVRYELILSCCFKLLLVIFFVTVLLMIWYELYLTMSL
jgi:hypothetical protein